MGVCTICDIQRQQAHYEPSSVLCCRSPITRTKVEMAPSAIDHGNGPSVFMLVSYLGMVWPVTPTARHSI